MTGQTTYTTRQAAYDLRKLRSKDLIVKPGRSRRYHLPPQPARIITALLTLREQVIGPILAGIRSPRMGRKAAIWTRVDRDYETLRINMQTRQLSSSQPSKDDADQRKLLVVGQRRISLLSVVSFAETAHRRPRCGTLSMVVSACGLLR